MVLIPRTLNCILQIVCMNSFTMESKSYMLLDKSRSAVVKVCPPSQNALAFARLTRKTKCIQELKRFCEEHGLEGVLMKSMKTWILLPCFAVKYQTMIPLF